jgi:hypothetical protein
MTENYLMLIIDGWINNKEYLENYFYREFKSAQRQDIPPEEFALHLNKEVIRIDRIRLEPYYSELEMWNDYYVQETRKGNKVDMKIPDNADGYSTPLLNLTNGKYVGHIGKTDLEYIKDCIDKAFGKISNENKPGKREIAKWFEDWLNMSTEKKYADALAEYNKKFPMGSIKDFHLMEREHLIERIDSYKKLVNPDAFEIKAKIEREKLLKYIDGLDKEVLPQQTEVKTIEENPNDLRKVPFIGSLLNKHLNISERILGAYFSLVPQPRSRKDVSDHYVGKLNHHNQPYQVSIYGVYPLMKYWEMIDYNTKNVNDSSGYFKNWQREKVYEALKDYAKGFQQGFNNFLSDVIDNENSLSSSESIRLQKIKDYVFNSWNNEPGFSEVMGKGAENVFSGWFEDGKKGGYFYKAWYLILENHLAFAPLFKEIEQETFEDLRTFMDQVNNEDAASDESFKRGFKRLHEYIDKNVHNDVNAELPRLKQLERNLLNWKTQLEAKFFPTENNQFSKDEDWKQKAEKIILHIKGALEVIQLRIKGKEQLLRILPTEKKKAQKIKLPFAPKPFNELFDNPALINDCLALLKTTDKPCINDENQFLRNKGAFVVWLNALEKKKMFKFIFSNDAERAATLKYNFDSLDISESLFRQPNTRATDRYKNHFENEISAMKH